MSLLEEARDLAERIEAASGELSTAPSKNPTENGKCY